MDVLKTHSSKKLGKLNVSLAGSRLTNSKLELDEKILPKKHR